MTALYTTEVLGDDGTYGSSGDYVFWFDTRAPITSTTCRAVKSCTCPTSRSR
jgi:hypothetical protein